MRTITLLAMLFGLGLVGCQSTGLNRFKKESVSKQKLEDRTALTKTRKMKRRAGRRGLDQYSLYDQGEIDRKLLRRGQKNRFRR